MEVDHREENEEVIQLLLDHGHVDAVDYPIELDVGDYRTEEAIFEVKHSVSDYAASMQDGRLQSQIERMLETDRRPYVLLGFAMTDMLFVPRSNVNSSSLFGFMASLMADFNVPILACEESEILVDMLVRLARKEEREKELIVEPGVEVEKVEHPNIRFLCTIDGIGVNTAERINEHFPTPASIIQSSPSDLARVDGIGEKTAMKILNAYAGGEML